jgi:amidase
MTRTVTDAAWMMDVLVGYDPADPYSAAHSIARRERPYVTELAPDGLRGARVGVVTNALGAVESAEMAAVNAVVRGAVEAVGEARAEVVELEIPELMDHIVATSMYTDRSKHDIDLFLSELSDSPARALREIYEAGKYHRGLDLMDAIIAGADDPEEGADYLRASRLATSSRWRCSTWLPATSWISWSIPECRCRRRRCRDVRSGPRSPSRPTR